VSALGCRDQEFRVCVVKIQGVGYRVQVLWFRGRGLGFVVEGLGSGANDRQVSPRGCTQLVAFREEVAAASEEEEEAAEREDEKQEQEEQLVEGGGGSGAGNE